MELAKRALDIGVYTRDLESVAGFWVSIAGVEPDFVQPITRSVKQHRFNLGDGVLKFNEVAGELADGSSGFGRVLVACDSAHTPFSEYDPDGTELTLWPRGKDGIEHWAVEVLMPSENTFLDFYETTLGLPRAEGHPCAVRCGVSLISCVVTDPDQLPSEPVSADIDTLQMKGLRYITIQVTDVDAVCASLQCTGACIALAPVTLGETARIAFIRDPVGNYMELSQRASLTGALRK